MIEDFANSGLKREREKSGPVLNVPDHILDMIPEHADSYIENNIERLLGGIPEDQRAGVLAKSTHHKTRDPERRELHRKILLALTGNLIGEKSEKPIMVYISGPMAVGKTAMRNQFDERISSESAGQDVGAYRHSALEDAYQLYKKAARYRMQSDFPLYKQMLPEFEQSGKNFTLIRAEASALDQAATAWAKELGANIVMEQMGDADMRNWARQQAGVYSLVVIGVTADPVANAKGLTERCKDTGQEIKAEELAKTIIGYSKPEAFLGMAQHATYAVLLSSDQGYEPIYVRDNGRVRVLDKELFGGFASYADKDVNALVDSFLSGVAASPKSEPEPTF